jgi:hypothetical protein
MTERTLIEILFHLFSDLLWLETDRVYHLSAVTTIKCDITTLRIECIFSFFPKGWDIDEVSIGRRHRRIIEKNECVASD